MISLSIKDPVPEDAPEWFDFVVEQQTRTYCGIVRPDFADVQREFRDTWVPQLAADFAKPNTAQRLIVRHEGKIVGVASVEDAPCDWEHQAGFISAPASRCLDRLYLHPEVRGKGLGTKLLAELDDGRDLYLWLVDGNNDAQRFYRNRGFVDESETFLTGESWGNVTMHRMIRRIESS